MTQFARAVGLGLTLASYGMLEHVLLKENVGQSAVPRLRQGGQSPFPNQCGSAVPESVASTSSHSLPTIPEVGERHIAEVGSAGDFGENGTLGSLELVGSPRPSSSGQPAVPED